MVKRPVKLQSTGNPRAQSTDKSRFYDMVLIEKIISIRFIFGSIYLPTDFRQYLEFQIFILQFDKRIFFIHLLFPIHFQNNFIGIRIATRPLVYPVFGKHRQFFTFGFCVCRNTDFTYRHLDRLCFRACSEKQNQKQNIEIFHECMYYYD